jgi:hypothetical protein
MKPKVGEVIYVRNEYQVTYAGYEVVGETSRSWLVLPVGAAGWQKTALDRYARKLPKSGKGYIFGTQADQALAQWASKNRYNIGSFLQGTADAAVILAVAKLIGYKNLPEVAQ